MHSSLEERAGLASLYGVSSLCMVNRFLCLSAIWFGAGKSPVAPGTVATVAAIPVAWLLSFAGDIGYVLVAFALSAYGIVAAQAYEDHSGTHDSSAIVIDEVAGYLITVALLPMTWVWMALGFVLFRVLDIVKPWPISHFDRNVGGGVGVMADDIIAGLMGNFILHIIYTYLHGSAI